jgi:hypothetical protein
MADRYNLRTHSIRPRSGRPRSISPRPTVTVELTEPIHTEAPLRNQISGILRKGEYIKAFWDTTVNPGTPISEDTSWFRSFGNRRVKISVDGPHGGTAFMVVSSQGAYVAHWWEALSFSSEDLLKRRTLTGIKDGISGYSRPHFLQYFL